MLYNESIPLAQRYVDFRAAFDEFYKPQGLNHYQDLHAISVYLTFEYPDKYYIYKYKVFKDFSNNIGYVIDRSKFQSEVYKLEAYFEMCELVLDEVKRIVLCRKQVLLAWMILATMIKAFISSRMISCTLEARMHWRKKR